MFQFKYSLQEICEITSPLKIIGNTNSTIVKISDIEAAKNGELSFLGNAKYRSKLNNTNASVVLIKSDTFTGSESPKENQCFLLYDNPSYALGLLCKDIEKKCINNDLHFIHPSAVIAETAEIDDNVTIGPNVVVESNVKIKQNTVILAGCYLGSDVVIGKNVKLYPGVKIMDFCEIGDNVVIHAGVVVGSDGFGYETVNGIHEKIPQIGNVIIEDDVEIGANTTIDRARFSSTIIGKGTKIDNLVQIGHNVHIGKYCLIVSQVGIAGSSKLGNYVIVGGQSGIAGHLTIGDRSMIAGQTGIASSCKEGSFLRGSPAMPYNEATRYLACRKYLPELVKKMKGLKD